MKAALANYRINPKMDGVFIRKARKTHVCAGGHNGERCVPCPRLIRAGTAYVEYLGESQPYHSGHRYHPECACQQGLLVRIEAPK